MTEEIPFAKSLLIDRLVMLDCSTRRSIIGAVSHAYRNDLEEYISKKWTVKYLGTKHFIVTDNITGTEYFVTDYYDGAGATGYGVYKKVEKK